MRQGLLHSVRDTIECMRVKPLLQPFLDSELDDTKRSLVAKHLEACRRCGLAASTYRALKERRHAMGKPVEADAVARLVEFVDGLAGMDDSPPSADGSAH